jgi:hypothetical protein
LRPKLSDSGPTNKHPNPMPNRHIAVVRLSATGLTWYCLLAFEFASESDAAAYACTNTSIHKIAIAFARVASGQFRGLIGSSSEVHSTIMRPLSLCSEGVCTFSRSSLDVPDPLRPPSVPAALLDSRSEEGSSWTGERLVLSWRCFSSLFQLRPTSFPSSLYCFTDHILNRKILRNPPK